VINFIISLLILSVILGYLVVSKFTVNLIRRLCILGYNSTIEIGFIIVLLLLFYPG